MNFNKPNVSRQLKHHVSDVIYIKGKTESNCSVPALFDLLVFGL